MPRTTMKLGLLIFRGQVTTIPGPFPGSPGAAQVNDEV